MSFFVCQFQRVCSEKGHCAMQKNYLENLFSQRTYYSNLSFLFEKAANRTFRNSHSKPRREELFSAFPLSKTFSAAPPPLARPRTGKREAKRSFQERRRERRKQRSKLFSHTQSQFFSITSLTCTKRLGGCT